LPSQTTFTINILITIKVEIKDNLIEQSFYFNKREKGVKVLFNDMYEGYHTFERMLRKYSLRETQVRFLERIVEEDRIILVYEKNGEFEIPVANTYFTVSTKVPPNTGCEFCEFKQIVDNLNFKCTLKEKVMNKEIKTCNVFKQRKEL